jgi:hypothetical protein
MITLALTLGLGVQKADAGACKKMGYSNGCVTSADVKNNNLKAADLKDEAGADFAGGNQDLDLLDTDTVVRSVTITAPRSGVVIVNASGYFDFGSAAGIGRCSITTGTTLNLAYLIIAEGDAATTWIPFGATRGFTVGKGSTTFNLVCDGTLGVAEIFDTNITAIYVPTRY